MTTQSTPQQELASFQALVARRRSVRAFKPAPVPESVLHSVFELAQAAPSNCNTQPWRVAVASGDALESLRKQVPEAMMQGDISWDIPYQPNYRGVHRDRQYAAANALYSAMGIERSDKAGRDTQFFKNFEFFGAPHAAFLFLPRCFIDENNSGIRESADLGMYAQTLMLSMVAHGLGCCPQTALSFTGRQIHEAFDIGDDHLLLFGISFGYEDPDHASANARTERAAMPDCVSFHS